MLECKDQYLPALFLVLTFFSVMPVQGEEPYAIESFAAKASAQLPAEIVNAVEPFSFDRVYGAFWDMVIETGGKVALQRSAERYLRAIGG